jgi:hypothetical protein
MKLRDSLAAAALAAICITAPAYAQNNNSNVSGTNNSNFTGVNNSNMNGTNFGSPGSTTSVGYNAATLSQAQSLQQQLAAAQNALDTCNAKPAPAPSGPRSFTRTSQAQACGCAGGAAGCPEGERAQLEANLAKAKADAAAFLESTKNPGKDMLAVPQATAAVGPTW